MSFSAFYFFVEGTDDERFVNSVFYPTMLDDFSLVYVIKYRKQTLASINKKIRGIKTMRQKGHSVDYFFLGDKDKIEKTVNEVKTDLCLKYSELEPGKVGIVVKEIESWYLAGIEGDLATKIKVDKLMDTQGLGKEYFEGWALCVEHGKNYAQMLCLSQFNTQLAAQKNQSFKYCALQLGIKA